MQTLIKYNYKCKLVIKHHKTWCRKNKWKGYNNYKNTIRFVLALNRRQGDKYIYFGVRRCQCKSDYLPFLLSFHFSKHGKKVRACAADHAAIEHPWAGSDLQPADGRGQRGSNCQGFDSAYRAVGHQTRHRAHHPLPASLCRQPARRPAFAVKEQRQRIRRAGIQHTHCGNIARRHHRAARRQQRLVTSSKERAQPAAAVARPVFMIHKGNNHNNKKKY